MSEDYNGWTNYETWVTKLWIDNEQSSQEYWLEQAKECLALPPSTSGVGQPRYGVYQLAERLKDSHEATADEYVFDAAREGLIAEASVFSDLMRHALGCVNWHEIAESIIEDAKDIGS